MQSYVLILGVFGAIVLLTAWLPMVLRDLPLSLPIFCVLLGALIGYAVPGEEALSLRYPEITERLTELVVIVALMGAGLKLDRPPGFRSWIVTWRLLAITMPLSIAGIALLGWGVAGLPLVSALLLGAVLAPTDPVLASDVQVGPPGSGEEDEVRFGLTSEAGFNDGLAFPFTNLAIAAAAGGLAGAPDWLGDWLLEDVLWKLSAGLAVGWAVGKVLGVLSLPASQPGARCRAPATASSHSASLACPTACTELAHGYGFLAVFVTALALRHQERSHEYHEKLHEFSPSSSSDC